MMKKKLFFALMCTASLWGKEASGGRLDDFINNEIKPALLASTFFNKEEKEVTWLIHSPKCSYNNILNYGVLQGTIDRADKAATQIDDFKLRFVMCMLPYYIKAKADTSATVEGQYQTYTNLLAQDVRLNENQKNYITDQQTATLPSLSSTLGKPDREVLIQSIQDTLQASISPAGMPNQAEQDIINYYHNVKAAITNLEKKSKDCHGPRTTWFGHAYNTLAAVPTTATVGTFSIAQMCIDNTCVLAMTGLEFISDPTTFFVEWHNHIYRITIERQLDGEHHYFDPDHRLEGPRVEELDEEKGGENRSSVLGNGTKSGYSLVANSPYPNTSSRK